VKKLLDYCPRVSAGEEPSCVLHDRGLSAVVALGLFAVESKLKVDVAGVVCSLTFHSRLYLVQRFMFMYVVWGVPNIQDRVDWGGQEWLFQIIHVCVTNFWDNRLVMEILAKSGIMANLEVQDYELLVIL